MTDDPTDPTDHIVDKTGWAPGPWSDEPDILHWADEVTDLDCMLRRNDRMGNLCGYVAVPPGHLWHGKDMSDIDADVHGGITYASPCNEDICHVPRPGYPDNVWWLGFDCAHALHDRMPGMEAREAEAGLDPILFERATYKTVDYVRQECARLAVQIKEHS